MPAGAVFFCLPLDVEGEEADDCDLLLWEGGVVGLKTSKKYAENAMIIKSEGSSFIFKQFRIHEDKNLRSP